MVSADMNECSQCNILTCKKCIKEWTKTKKSCPNCREVYKPSDKPNRYVLNALNSFTFACNKCPATFKYCDYRKHVEECPYQVLRCPLGSCSATGNLETLLAHWIESCEEISLTCSKCELTTTRAN